MKDATQAGKRMKRMAVHSVAVERGGGLPEWIELMPGGEFHGRDGRGPFRMRNATGVIAATQALGMDAGIPIDYDHATDFAAPEGRPAPAAGWIRELEARDGSIWGRVEWTEHGAAAVKAHEYRYVSPVFEHGSNGEVVCLLRAALTNNPNLYLTAIAARDTRLGTDKGEADSMDSLISELRALLGLEEAATPENIVDAVRTLVEESSEPDDSADDDSDQDNAEMHSRAIADPARYVPLAHFQRTVGEFNALRAAHARERAERAVSDAIRAGKLVPAQREWAITYCQADFNGFAKFVARQPAVTLGMLDFEGEPRGAVSRSAGADSAILDRASSMLTATELNVCSALGIKPQDFMRRRTARGDMRSLN